MIRYKIPFIICFFLFVTLSSLAQNQINALDSSNQRHGEWKEYFDSQKTQLKFEGRFKHGKRIGVFKFYREGLEHPIAIMDFGAGSGPVDAQYLSQSGKVISEGKMLDQKRTGLWTYYHNNKDQIMMTEHYKKGLLDGPKKIFYEDGQLAEEAFYVNGQLDGSRKLYSLKGVVLEDLHYRNGELHGPARIYNGKGELLSEGVYRNDKHYGTWRYYENGNFKEEKEF